MKKSMRTWSKTGGVAVAGLAVLVCLVCLVDTPEAGILSVVSQEPESLEVAINKSILVKSPVAFTRISVANPNVADIIGISPTEIYVTGKAPGITNLILWQGGRMARIFDVEVGFDTSVLKRRLNDLLPEETGIRVTASPETLMLSGKVSCAAKMQQALSLAQSYAPAGKVNNMLEVGGVQQVMLEVKVSEMQKALMNQLGINWAYIGEAGMAGDMVGGLFSLSDQFTPGQSPTLKISQSVNTIFTFRTGNATQIAVIEALREEGLLKLLAEPTLIALSGQEATILVGGEYPIPVPQGLGTVAIEYKQYGVILHFTPVVLADNRISLAVAPEVSELDFSRALSLGGYQVPAITMRRAGTVVELGDGQSYAIAGLLKNVVRDKISKYPFLGEIPVLGNLFKSRQFQNEETELVIIVTPHLVKPLDKSKQSLPTDFYVQPDYVEFFVLGTMTGRVKKTGDVFSSPEAVPAAQEEPVVSGPTAQGQTDGDFGHAIPMVD